MSNIVYTAVATPPTGFSLNTNTSLLGIIATITRTLATETAVINFTLQGNVGDGRTAPIRAQFPAPSWSLGATITNVVPTFMIWMNTVNISTSVVFPAVNITTASSTSTTSAPETAVTPDTISGGSRTAPSGVATIPTPSTSPTSSPPISSHGYSAGELAGAVVGSFVAGLLIASVLLFFFRCRSKLKEHISEPDNSSIDEVQVKTLITGASMAKPGNKNFPQPDSDMSIAQLARRTFDEVEIFVEEFYTNKPATSSSLTFAMELSQFESPHLQGSLTDLLRNANNPIVLIKHCIAYFLLQKIDPSSNNAQSLLPREYIIPKSFKASGQEDRQALSQLRVLMANAYPLPAEDQQYLAQRDLVTGDAIREIEVAFQTWVRGDSNKRMSALKGIMVHVGELGIKLFSQPASFQWQWCQSGSHRVNGAIAGLGTEVVMLPGLDKTTDQKANQLPAPICLVKPRYGTWTE